MVRVIRLKYSYVMSQRMKIIGNRWRQPTFLPLQPSKTETTTAQLSNTATMQQIKRFGEPMESIMANLYQSYNYR